MQFNTNAAIGDYQGSDFYDLSWGTSFSGEISASGEVGAYHFSITGGGLVAFDVLADERKYSGGGDKITPVFSDGQWDQATFNDHNNDGTFSSLDAWLYLFRDDGNLTPDDYVQQAKLIGDGVIDNVPVIANPIPPALPLFASVAALLGYFGRKRSAA